MNGGIDDVYEVVQAIIHEILPDLEGRTIAASDQLTDLGADSMDRAEIVTLSMEALDLTFARAELARVHNVGELVEALHAKSDS